MRQHTRPDVLPPDAIPVIYLPSVGRPELRAVEECPRALQPLAELGYRGVLFTRKNGRDWTVAAGLTPEEVERGMEPLYAFHAQRAEEVEWFERAFRGRSQRSTPSSTWAAS